jgi:RNA polymerase sigma-70 factor (ECF subfamily)
VAAHDDPIDALATGSGVTIASRDKATAAWQAFVAAARTGWPEVTVDERQLAAFVCERLVEGDLAATLAAAPAADLAIAWACTAGQPAAHAAFDRVLSEVDAAGTATRAPTDVIDDVKQVLRVQLLVGKDGKPPGIAGYRGRGSLRGWLRITATRELIRHKGKRAKDAPLTSSLEDILVTTMDPSLDALKAEYRGEFAVALREAIVDLGAEDRTLLRQQIVDGLSIDEVGAAFGVHRATAARWLLRARTALVEATQRRLAERLALPVEQIESVIRLVASQLDASVVRYLREAEPASS